MHLCTLSEFSMTPTSVQPRRIAILGSTGSIGRNTLEVIARFPDRFRVTYLTANSNIGLLQQQIAQFKPRGVVVLERTGGHLLRSLMNGTTQVFVGEEGLMQVVQQEDVDLVVNALVGFAGLKPTIGAIEAGKNIALANKEALVVGGGMIMRRIHHKGVHLVPIDSEHSAILQCLRGEDLGQVRRLVLTASGGPFLHLDAASFNSITVAQALNHPTWKMGSKITIDSATLMNKGLEVIEARWLFGLPPDRIDVVIHPQSIIHSMVEFVDGSIKAQLSLPDMKLPIQYALTYPDRSEATYEEIHWGALGQMTFQTPDPERFPCLGLAYRALVMGGSAPVVLNAANEVAVQLFLAGRLAFTGIPSVIEEALDRHTPIPEPTLDDILCIDSETRRKIPHCSSIVP